MKKRNIKQGGNHFRTPLFNLLKMGKRLFRFIVFDQELCKVKVSRDKPGIRRDGAAKFLHGVLFLSQPGQCLSQIHQSLSIISLLVKRSVEMSDSLLRSAQI